MSGFRGKFINNVNKIASAIPTSYLQKLSNQKVILPFYHAISNEEIPHIKHLYSVKNIKSFVKDLDFLLKYYTPIDYNDFVELSKNKTKLKKPSFLLSFDDGLSEFHDIIAPILLEKGIPAICFLNSDFIDNKSLFYRYKASLLIDKLNKNPNLNKSLKKIFPNSKNYTSSILSISYQNKEILDEISKLIDVDFNDFLFQRSPYLTSNQIKHLIKKGFYFGAHSIDHPEYQYISLNEQLRQTRESIEYINKSFSIDYRIFSFPFTDFNISKEFFYQIKKNNIAEITFGCAGQKKDSISTNYQRIPFEMKTLSGKQIVNSELLYYLLKLPLNKNIVRRK